MTPRKESFGVREAWGQAAVTDQSSNPPDGAAGGGPERLYPPAAGLTLKHVAG